MFTDYDIRQMYDDFLNESYGTVTLAGIEYDTARVLRDADPTAYDVGLSDFASTLEESE